MNKKTSLINKINMEKDQATLHIYKWAKKNKVILKLILKPPIILSENYKVIYIYINIYF
jgi:hypothetical protein